MRKPVLWLIDGVTGSGKSSILKYIKRRYADSTVVAQKYTTRPRREGDKDWELVFVEELPKRLALFSYESTGWSYSIDVDEVAATMASGFSCALVCVDKELVSVLRSRFNTRHVYVYRVLDARKVVSILASRKTLAIDEARSRVTEVEEALKQYARNIATYDFVVLNVGGLDELFAQVDELFGSA